MKTIEHQCQVEKPLNTMEKSMEKQRKQRIDEHFAEVDENNGKTNEHE